MSKLFLRSAVAGSEGDGAEVNRLFPIQGFMNFDPFVLWDDFNVPPEAGFPDHPHRGFEGITYVFQGSMNHSDNLGNNATVESGGLQRFTAGKGIIHSEMPSKEGATRGIQLWVNLPQKLKQVEPAYQQVNARDVPVRDIDGGHVRELAGDDSPLQLNTAVRYMDVTLEAGGELNETMPDGHKGFVYMLEGNANVNGYDVEKGNALFFDDETSIDASASESCRFLVCFGQPHGEPIYQHGPYVD